MSDPLAEMVTLLQPAARYSKFVSGAGTWRVERQETGQPFYCVVLEGSALLSAEGKQLTLREGDFILIPAAHAFTMSSLDDGLSPGIDPLTVTMLPVETRHGDPEGAPNARLLVGHFAFGSPDAALLVSLLPRIIHIRGDSRLSAIVQLVTDEARAERPGKNMILARLLEVLLVEALRSNAGEKAPLGILRGLGDPRLAVAIRRLHENPSKEWTVQQLAGEAALSRSAFFNRFRRAVGLAPMEYLISWRMALAKNLLRQEDIGIQEIAERVGYGSASAFSTAFTRFAGLPPSRYAEQSKTISNAAA
ncbi:AraC family transcriptional regulator [Rhizobium phaseoli]|uniref:AraC family transcriptional regulator n=1 Tax=Rhizobium phaseoli TaxID=396 RepID=UPI00038280F6|nr:AraC family transcriptional regulator [Rhizobium phaseoli]KKZ83968.1 putative AraC family transcriptional regulator [Rhizobium phaseoli Ch24-10]RDJ04911.1 AraC family transcriptional regulator [Rhizobium phaseoli]RDJ07153.1 AraC family transcriptional regulator [Rhizobium phaseoli]